jgi:hypothetical protein
MFLVSKRSTNTRFERNELHKPDCSQYHVWLASAVCMISGLLEDLVIILMALLDASCAICMLEARTVLHIGVCYIYLVLMISGLLEDLVC